MMNAIGSPGLQFNLMSVNPKQSDTVLSQKQWTILGKVPITGNGKQSGMLSGGVPSRSE